MSRVQISKRLGWGGSFQGELYNIFKGLVDSFKEYLNATAATVTDEVLTGSPDLKTFTFANDNVVASTATFKNALFETVGIKVTAGATGAGDIIVTVSDTVSATVAIVAEDDTPEKVAAKVAGATYAGYIATVSGDIVTFKATTVGNKNTDTAGITGGATGVTGERVAGVAGTSPEAINASDISSIEYAYLNGVTSARVVFKTAKEQVTSTYKHVANMPASMPEFVD